MKEPISVFKIRIDSIQKHAIGFELFAGERVSDTYVNILVKGGYGVKDRLLLTPKQFSDFAQRLIAYVYTTKSQLSDEQLKTLWELKLNIFNSETQQISGSIFDEHKSRLIALGLVKRRSENDRPKPSPK